MKMKYTRIAILAFLIPSFAVASEGSTDKDPSGTTPTSIEKKSEEFTQEVQASFYKDPSGTIPASLDKNKITFFYFSSSTCGPCRRVTPLLLDFIKRHNDVTQLVHVNQDENEKTMVAYWKKSHFNCPMIPSDGKIVDELHRRAGIDWGVPKVIAFLPDGTLLTSKGRDLIGSFLGTKAFAPEKDKRWKKIVESAQNHLKERFQGQIKAVRKTVGQSIYLDYYAQTYWLDEDSSDNLGNSQLAVARKKFVSEFKGLTSEEKLRLMGQVNVILDATLLPEGWASNHFWTMPQLFFELGAQDDPEVAKIIRKKAPATLRKESDWPLAAYVLGSHSVASTADKSLVEKWKKNSNAHDVATVFNKLFEDALAKPAKAAQKQPAKVMQKQQPVKQ